MNDKLPGNLAEEIFEYLLRLGDDRLILGHRLSEWCGHAPILEEDIALTNIALDCVGQASAFLSLAAEVEEKGRTEDDLAYLREATQFKNLHLLEQPNTDFAYTIVRQFFYDVFSNFLYEELSNSKFEKLAGIAAKSLKEVKYHLRHSREWLIRLGDGTEESHQKAQNAIDDLWRFTGEMFYEDEIDIKLIENSVVSSLASIKPKWDDTIKEVLNHSTLTMPPSDYFMISGSRKGLHTEHLGHLLAEMQIVVRSYPGAKW